MVIRKEKSKESRLITRRPNDLQMNIDKLFDRFRSSFDELFWGPETNLMTSSNYRTPLMDVVDLGDKYEMHIEMPGIKKGDINIEITPTMVEICAEHEEAAEDKGKNWVRQERRSTDFYRCLELPEELKTGNVEAELKDGVLTLSLPKAEPKPKFEATKVKIK